MGEYSVADVAITPFLARARVALLNEFGGYPEGEGKRVLEALTSGEGKFARFGRYFNDLLARESFKATFDEVCACDLGLTRSGREDVADAWWDALQGYVTERFKVRFGNLRNPQ